MNERNEWVYGLKSIADRLGVSERTLRRWIQEGRPDLPIFRGIGRYFAHPDDLDRWLRRGMVAA